MTLEIKVLNGAGIPENEVQAEILLAETRMNSNSKLRFHLTKINDTNSINQNDLDRVIPNNDLKYFNNGRK